MSQFNLTYNPERNQFEGQIKAEVISMGDSLKKNVNGTEYVVGAIRFTDATGKTVERSAICYVKNLDKGVEVGNTYLCNVTITAEKPNEPFISISPLTSAERSSANDFGFDFEAALAEASVGAEELETK